MKLTLPQHDIYFEQLLHPNEPIYNIGAKIEISGSIIYKVLNEAYIKLIDQHDTYRSVVSHVNDEVQMEVLDSHNSYLRLLDFSKENNPYEIAHKYMQDAFKKPFDLNTKKLLHQFILIKVRSSFYYLFSVYHHLITDGWGTSLMFQRLVKNYNELIEYGQIKTQYHYSYADFVRDDNDYAHSNAYVHDKQYWKEKFKNLPEPLFEKINKSVKDKSNRKELVIKRKIYNQVSKVAVENTCSTFHVILGALYLYFSRKHQNKDIGIGIPVLNRGKASYKKTVGLFMGLSVLRIPINFEDSFVALTSNIKQQLRKDYRYQRFPLGKLIQELDIYQEKDRLFNITLSYEKQDYADHFINTKTRVIPMTHQSERVALAVYIREFDQKEDVKIDFDYNLNYFDDITISQLTTHFETLINNIITFPNKKLNEFEYISEEEQEQLIVDFNNTNVKYSKKKTLLHFFSEQVKKYPQKTAVFDDKKKYSYSELDTLSNQIAEFLLANNGQEKTPIGLLVERSATTIAFLLGILKAGKAYIPMDPTFPLERLKYIIKHSNVKTLISDKKNFNIEVNQIEIITVNSVVEKSSILKGDVSINIEARDTAYVIYTSGSTGNPKGVEIGHQSLLNFLLSMQQIPGFKPSDCLFAVTTYSFDISILEFFVPLTSGASVFIAKNTTLSDPKKSIKKINQINPTIIQGTPSFYQLLMNAGWKGNSKLKILCGGDLLSEDLAEKLLHNCYQLWNMYGPTETTIWSSTKQIKSSNEASNIGNPISNTKFYILDQFKRILPIEANGLLYIGGDGLAKGYFNNSSLTKEKFVPNPFEEGGGLYDTGDIAKWNVKGEVEFLGRKDNQVKVRGYRIELGEIESKINLISEIKQSVVVVKKQSAQESFLVAFIIKEIESYDEKDIITLLEQELPNYMIPHAIIALKEFPLTPNKKIDRKTLSNKNILNFKTIDSFIPPESELQRQLIKYWKQILFLENEISITDNFFALGGHSLNAVKLTHLINTQLDISINLKTIFDYPTIKSFSKYLNSNDFESSKKIPFAKMKPYYALTSTQSEIWLASQHKNISIAYNMVAAFRIKGRLNKKRVNDVMNIMLEKHDILRTNFVEINGIIYQQIKPYDSIEFNLSCILEESEIDYILNEYINQEFDLKNDLLIKMKLIQTSVDTSILIFCTHHTIMDGWSLELFTKEFMLYYNDDPLQSKNIYNKPKAQIQFKDYSEWLSSSSNASDNSSFWEHYLSNYHIKESFKTDKLHKTTTYQSNQHNLKLDITTLELKKLAQAQKTTIHNLLATIMNILIYKYSNHKDICLAIVNSGRNLPELSDTLGMLAKTLILRTKVSEQQTFKKLLQNIQEDSSRVNTYQDIPQKLRKKVKFDILMVYQNSDFSYQETLKLNDVNLKILPVEVNYCRFPLLFNFYEINNEMNLSTTYNSELYDEETIQIISLKFNQVLNEVTKNPTSKISDINILLAFEKRQKIDINFNF